MYIVLPRKVSELAIKTTRLHLAALRQKDYHHNSPCYRKLIFVSTTYPNNLPRDVFRREFLNRPKTYCSLKLLGARFGSSSWIRNFRVWLRESSESYFAYLTGGFSDPRSFRFFGKDAHDSLPEERELCKF